MTIDIDFISALIGLTLTLMVFSYLIGDNPLFRIAVYLFVGAASGYAASVVYHSILAPRLPQLLTLNPLVVIPVILSLTVLAKLFPRISSIGNLAMAVLVGVGAATVVGGALVGTLLPQSQATIDGFNVLSAGGLGQVASQFFRGTVILVGTVFTLASFHFTAGRTVDGAPKRNRILQGIAWVGRIFIAITLGVLFAGVYMSALTALIERLSSIINFIRQLFGF